MFVRNAYLWFVSAIDCSDLNKPYMIRLALAIGFLAVFGLVAYALVLLLTNYFSNKDKQNK